MNKVLKSISIVLIIAVIGYIGYKLAKNDGAKEQTQTIQAGAPSTSSGTAAVPSTPEATGGKTGKDDAALPVKAIQVHRGNLPLRLNISANADAWDKTTIQAELSGTIESIDVKVGSPVKAGQLLMKLDDTERKLDLQQQEAQKLVSFSKYLVSQSTVLEDTKLTPEQKQNLDAIKKKYIQATKDFEAGKITRKELESIAEENQKLMIFSGDLREEVRKAQEGLSTATVGVKMAELNLKRTEIRAPFPGLISDIFASKGSRIGAGQNLIRVVNLNSLFLRGYALESEISNLKVGTKVRIKFDSYSENFVYGEIQAINPEIDPTRKTLAVYVKVDNKDNKFFPGMHAEIDVEYKVFENVIKVPRNAVIFRQDRYLVFVVKDMKGNTGIANWEYVTIGNQNDDEIEILSGVQEGDMVLVEGHQTLAHQSKVRIIQD